MTAFLVSGYPKVTRKFAGVELVRSQGLRVCWVGVYVQALMKPNNSTPCKLCVQVLCNKEFIRSLSQVPNSELLKTLGISWVIRVSLLCNGMTHSRPLDRFHGGLVLRRTNHRVIGANLTQEERAGDWVQSWGQWFRHTYLKKPIITLELSGASRLGNILMWWVGDVPSF